MADQRRNQQRNRTDEYRLYAMLSDRLGEAFERFLRESRPRLSKKAVLVKLLEDMLAEKGYWEQSARESQESSS